MAIPQTFFATPVRMNNFCGQLSGKLTSSTVSSSFTFSPPAGTLYTSFKMTNKGTKGAYYAGGVGSATAQASSTTGNGLAGASYIAAGAILTEDFQSINGVVDTLAVIQGSDSQDNGATTIEVTLGFGQ